MRRTFAITLTLVAAFAGAPAAFAQTVKPADAKPVDALAQAREEARRLHESIANRSAELPGGPYRLRDLCVLYEERGKIMFRSTALGTGDRRTTTRVKLTDLPGAYVQAGMRGTAFNLTINDFSKPDVVRTETNVNWSQYHFSLARTVHQGQGYQQLTLTQGMTALDADGRSLRGAVTLHVRHSDLTGNAQVEHNCAAPDLLSLRRQNARVVDEYLRPVLREIHQESLLAVDAAQAWQVFVDDWPVDRAVAAEVERLLPGLDAEKYEQRDAAMRALAAKGQAGALVLYRADRKRLTAQQNMAVDAAMSGYELVGSAEGAALRRDLDFLLDCLYSDDASIRAAAMKHVRAVSGRPVEIDAALLAEQRAAAVDELRRVLVAKPAAATRPAK